MNLRGYLTVTAAYWSFTLTDGALRLLVLLHFHQQGLSPIALSLLFLLYEFCGVITNLFGGWWAARSGLKVTLVAGLALQIVALLTLSLFDSTWETALAISYIMGTQALSGVAKDLTKMSAKSSVKVLVPGSDETSDRKLLRWVAALTGSKNALKGVGFFLGGALLSAFGFRGALWAMAVGLLCIFALALFFHKETGRTKSKVKFTDLLSKSRQINWLSLARVFLFASRDVWFVVALPLFLSETFGWDFYQVGGFMAAWVIGYGIIQAGAPQLVRGKGQSAAVQSAVVWCVGLAAVISLVAALATLNLWLSGVILVGLFIYGAVFAVNSSLHSYLILAFSKNEDVTLSVGFYYMANAWGRLLGTLLSGLIYQFFGLNGCLWVSFCLVVLSTLSVAPLRKA